MIDQNGNRIVDKSQAKDTALLLAEAKFLMKGFPKDGTDKRALDVAARINTFLGQDGNISDVSDMLTTLAAHSAISRSEAFVWELVYIWRKIMYYQNGHDTPADELAEYAQIYMNLYNTICKLLPTPHNCACRVNGYMFASEQFALAKQKGKARETRITARKLFEEIVPNDSKIYHIAGMYLYYGIFECNFSLGNTTTAKFNVIKKSVEHTRALYQIEQTEQYLRFLASMFLSYSSFKQFRFEDEEENFRTLLLWLEEAPFSSYKLRLLKRKLNNSWDKFKLNAKKQ